MGARLAFPPFTFDRDERVLRRDGRTVPLPPKVAEALGLLLAEPGALVEKNALRDTLWPDGFVEDGNLTQTIYLIRRALDPDGDGRAFVETIPRRGYRFVPPVSAVEATPRNAASRALFALRTAAAGLAIVVLSGGVSIGSRVANVPLTGDAARAYAVGRYNWNRRNEAAVRTAMGNFTEVVRLAPNDARGYAGLADVYMTAGDWAYDRIVPHNVAFTKAEAYAREALRRDPRSGEALTTLGWIAQGRDHDLERSERILREAIALRPDHAPAYEFLGIARLYQGDVDGGLRALRRSVELDPLSPIDLLWYGTALRYAHRYTEARTAFRQVLQLEDPFKDASLNLALVETELGNYDAAKAAIRAHPFSAHKKLYLTMFNAFIEIRSGHTPKALPDLRPRKGMHVDIEMAAELCLALGRREDALAWVRLGMNDPEVKFSRRVMAIEPLLAPLHNDARFRALTS